MTNHLSFTVVDHPEWLPNHDSDNTPVPHWLIFAPTSDATTTFSVAAIKLAAIERHEGEPITRHQMQFVYNITEDEIDTALKELTDLGFLRPVGDGRWEMFLEPPQEYAGPRTADEALERARKSSDQ